MVRPPNLQTLRMRNFSVYVLALGLLVSCTNALAAEWVFPNLGEALDRSDAARATRAEQLAQNEDVPEFDSIFELGCSWYCGGEVSDVRASSVLAPTRKHSYSPENAHDGLANTAWVEGNLGSAQGAWIEYELPPQKARVTTVLLYNGLIDSPKKWRENGRIKSLLLSINGLAFKQLMLADSDRLQSFRLGPIEPPDPKLALRLRFTIVDAYPGTRYDDIALTDLYFDGIGVH
jgi:hypothetical protein